MALFLVIQRASEPLCFISLPCYSARIRSGNDLWDRSDPPTARSDAPTCGCTCEYDKSQRIWARSAHTGCHSKQAERPWQTFAVSLGRRVSLVYSDRWFCNDSRCLLLTDATSCFNCEMKNRSDEHDWQLYSYWFLLRSITLGWHDCALSFVRCDNIIKNVYSKRRVHCRTQILITKFSYFPLV